MAATGEDITHYCGDSRTITIPVLDEDGAAVSLAGASARWWMAADADATEAADIYIQKSTSAGITITGPATVDGVASVYSLVITLAPADTKNLAPGARYHEAEITDASGAVATITTGTFTLVRDLVRT